jgi:hypothetical protein
MCQSTFFRMVSSAVLLLWLASCGDAARYSDSTAGASGPETSSVSPKSYATGGDPAKGRGAVIRLAHLTNKTYRYVLGADEAANIWIGRLPGAPSEYRYEGVVMLQDSAPSAISVYRFKNRVSGHELLTADPLEISNIPINFPDFVSEGVAFTALPLNAPNSSPVYRLVNIRNGAYLYTISTHERNFATGTGDWRLEDSSFSVGADTPELISKQ